MQDQVVYHPSLFTKPEEENAKTRKEGGIPQTTLYDIPIRVQTAPVSKHVTIFGFSPQNRESVLKMIFSTVRVERREEGKNYISVWTEDPMDLEKLMKLNFSRVNGEIIGVFRRSFGAVNDESIYAKKRGVFQAIFDYFFG